MAATVLVDTGFLVALLNRRDIHHSWAAAHAEKSPPPWRTCEPVLSEVFHIVGPPGTPKLMELLSDRALVCAFRLDDHLGDILRLLQKYADVPMSLADACLVRMTEVLSNPIVLTTDSDFRVYRRHGRQVVPSVTPH